MVKIETGHCLTGTGKLAKLVRVIQGSPCLYEVQLVDSGKLMAMLPSSLAFIPADKLHMIKRAGK